MVSRMSDEEFQTIDSSVAGAIYGLRQKKDGTFRLEEPISEYHTSYNFTTGNLALHDEEECGPFISVDESAEILNSITEDKRQAYLKRLSERQVTKYKQIRTKGIAKALESLRLHIELWDKTIDDHMFRE